MVGQRRRLTVYHCRRQLDGDKVVDLRNYLRKPDDVREYEPGAGELGFDARFFLPERPPAPPSWADLVDEGFPDISIPWLQSANAVLMIRVKYYGRDRVFALTFGHGRHLLRADAYDRGYGLRVALNLIYGASGELDPDRLRSVGSRTVSENTIRTYRQVDRRADFETFGVDIQADLLHGVVGAPVDTDKWGTRIAGGDSFSANPVIDFFGLGEFCVDVARAYRQRTYQEQFDWIDKLRVVAEPATLEILRDKVIQRIQGGTGITVAVPELVEWDEIGTFSRLLKNSVFSGTF